jgi:type IV secretory pathway protease TraF
VIVFIYPCDPDRDYIKRVIALAGDSVEVRCNVVYVNGVAVPSQLEDPDCTYRDRVESTGEWYTARCSTYAETVDGKVYRTFHDPERPNRDRTLAAGDDHDFPLHDHATAPTCANAPPSEVASDYPPQVVGEIVQATSESKAKVCEQRIHYVVPPGHIFAQGDNRNNSSDSRVWGSVPIENIKGKALFIWLSLDEHFELLKPWKPDGIRFRRIGNFVE